MIYWEHNQYRNAIKFYGQSLVYNKELASENGIAMLNKNEIRIKALDILENKTEHSFEFFVR